MKRAYSPRRFLVDHKVGILPSPAVLHFQMTFVPRVGCLREARLDRNNKGQASRSSQKSGDWFKQAGLGTCVLDRCCKAPPPKAGWSLMMRAIPGTQWRRSACACLAEPGCGAVGVFRARGYRASPHGELAKAGSRKQCNLSHPPLPFGVVGDCDNVFGMGKHPAGMGAGTCQCY